MRTARKRLLRLRGENGVPVVAGGTEPLDGRKEGGHRVGRMVAGGIAVKATVDWESLFNQGGQPFGVWAGPCGGDAAMIGMEGTATDGVDG